MSFNFAGFLFASTTLEPTAILRAMGLEARALPQRVELAAATRTDFLHSAIGVVGTGTILINHFLPYDCSFEPGGTSPLDRRLAPLSEEGPLLAFYLNGHAGYYGFSLFEGGARVRRRATSPAAVAVDEGAPLPQEAPYPPGHTDDEARLFALSKRFLGARLDRLIMDSEDELYVYDTG